MNILPKKSWHVRNKDNIAKVRRDEAKAAEEEKERERRRALAEQEARTELLRSRARQRLGEGGKETIEGPSSSKDTSVTGTELVPATSLDHRGHINFFKDLEEGKKVGGVNKEHEEEKKKEQEQREKDIGLLTYLGQSAVEAQGNKPWYLNKTRRDDTLKKEDEEQDKSSSVSSSLDMKRKNFLDPVHDMNRYLSKKRSKQHQEEHKKRHKKKHKEKDRDRQKGSESRSRQGPSVSVAQLRAERLKREAEERAKTERLLALRRGEAPKPTEAEVMETSKFRYNSQFNPDLVRKPRPRYQPY